MVYDTSLLIWAAGTSRNRYMEMPDTRGHLAESAVGAYLLAQGKENGFSVYWWREKEKEIDFVIEKGAGNLSAIEVKSGRIKHLGRSMEFKTQYPHALSLVVGSENCSLGDFLEGKIPLFK